MNALGRAARRCAAAAVLSLIAVPSVADQAAAECRTVIGGEIGGADGSYGGSGSAVCDVGADGSGAAYSVLRVVRPEPSLCAGTPDALQEIVELREPSSGALVDRVVRCIGPNIPGDPAPVPPSVTDVMQRLPLPMPEIHTSPRNRGLVGVETWLWWGGEDTPPPVVIGVDGWTATVQPRLARIEWDMGNGDVVEGNGPGSEAQPSATYVYERQCDCTITVTLVWAGSVTFSHPLVPAALVQESPGVPFTTSMPYEVEEREAVIVR
jgi:hypothetical protein